MKLLTAQGHFGVLDGRQIRFEDGLNVLYLPNEGGKTTLCNFLRVMLYGLNTSKRDTRNQLSDKTRFRPVDGNPMSGLLQLEWKGREIIISRQTGKGTAPMQEFSAVYADTGEPCEELTAKDCGRILTGVSEEAFQSSALLDGQDQALSAGELEQRMLELSTSGDNAAVYSSAVSQLDQWKNALRGTGNRGRYAAVEQELDGINHAVSRLDELTAQIAAYEAQIPAAQQAIEDAEQKQQEATEAFTLLFVAKREAAEKEERQAREKLTQLKKELIDDSILNEAETLAPVYADAKQMFDAASAELEEVTENYQKWQEDIDHTEEDYSQSSSSISDIHIRGWSMVVAIALGVLAVISLLGLISFGSLTAYMPYVFSLLAVVFLIITFVGSTQTLDTPPMDFDEERVKLQKRRQQAISRVEQTMEKLAHVQNKFQKVLREMDPKISADDSEELVVFIAQARECNKQYLARQQEYEKLKHQYLDILEKTGPNGEVRVRMDEAKEAAAQARQRSTELHEAIAACRGKKEEIGERSSLCAQRSRLQEERENILWQLDAIRLAKEALVQAHAELTGRVSPQINKLAEQYLRILTAERYTAMQLYTDLEATCRRENSAVEMDRLRLSTGTRDQLYLALRLAVCKVLLDKTDESVPLILDDPFVNYDDQRVACGMKLLREIAHERQVILLTCRRP